MLPRAVFDLLDSANEASTVTLARASALAVDHRATGGPRRLIGLAMNISRWMLNLNQEQARRHPFFDDVLFGIRARADAAGADLLLLTGVSSQVSGEATHYGDICRAHRAEAIIVAAFLPDEPELAELIGSGFPTVAIDTQLIGPRASFVSSDNVGGAAAAVRHLVDLGRRRIAYVGAWGSEPANIDRRLGYESALVEAGLELREDYMTCAGWSHVLAHDETCRLLALKEPPDAIFCASDVMAIGAIRAIEKAGMRVPEDIAVAGFDDSDYATLAMPSLTSVRQDRIGLGTAAVEAVLRMLDSPDSSPESSLLPTELVTRESTTIRSGADQPIRPEARAGPLIGAPSSRLSVEAVYRLLGEASEPEPLTPGESSPVMRQEWDPAKRRLIALALDTATDQSFRHAFFDELFYRIRAQAYSEELDLLVFTNVGTISGASFPPFLELCHKHGADGLVIGSLPVEEPNVAALADSDFPCVTLDVDLLSDRVAFVMSDNVGGGIKVVRHLIEAGHQRIAFIGGRGDERPTVDRRFGYLSELSSWNLPRPQEYVAMANWLPRDAYEATKRFLALPDPPDAIFCASDVMAIGAMAAIEDAGLRIPGDVAVAGFDDIDYARLVAPSLTTVHQSQEALASELITAILRLLDEPGASPAVSVIPVELVVRESSAAQGGGLRSQVSRPTTDS
ncbi:MAG: substrate-binding domain-containing protein [Gaiellaceae bacterium]